MSNKDKGNMLGVPIGVIKKGGKLSKQWTKAMKDFDKIGAAFQKKSDKQRRSALESVKGIIIGE